MTTNKRLQTLTKGELFKLIEHYPDNAEIEITVLQSDIDKCRPADLRETDKVYAFVCCHWLARSVVPTW